MQVAQGARARCSAGELGWIPAGMLCLFALAGYSNVYAFESNEHKLLGDTAVNALIQQYQCGAAAGNNQDTCGLLAQMDGSVKARLSYGDVVACVDFYLTPEKLIADFKESDRHLPHAWPEGACKSTPFKIFQASHSNHTHFQKELVVSAATYHQLATDIAREKNDVAGALFMNAIADHYLQDFFAPGHITTRRARLSDLFANAAHDAANADGATLHIGAAKDLANLKATSAQILALVAGGQPSGNAGAAADRITQIRKYLRGQETDDKACSEAVNMFATGRVTLKGDGLLERQDGCGQRLLMLAANMLSIEDVLHAGQGGAQQGALAEYDASFVDPQNRRLFNYESYLPDIRAELPVGYYALGTNKDTLDRNDRLLPLRSETVWGVSVGNEQFSSGTGVARMAGTLEAVVVGGVSPVVPVNYGLVLGLYGYGGSGDVSGKGVSARLGFIVPESETMISFSARRVNHAGLLMDEWGTGWAVRLDQGYTSFLTLYLSAGKDYEAETSTQLSYGTYLAAGVMFAAPTSRISLKSLKNFFAD